MLRNKVAHLKKEIETVSKEIIKPSSVVQRSPFKISILDQLIPSTYSPFTLFYPANKNTGHSASSATRRLKTSLSQTLTRFYPLSGRLRDNLFVDDFDQGVPFLESRVRCQMSDFLRHPQMDWLNDFVPCRPFAPEPNPSTMPQLAFKANIFDCGGIAVGLSLSHKFMDSVTIGSFLRSWAAAARGGGSHLDRDGDLLEESSALFPPVDPLPPIYQETISNHWFRQGGMELRRFVFSAEAIAALRTNARSEHVPNPTRNEALSSFIWKRVMSASTTVSGPGSSGRPCVLSTAVNIRSRAKPNFPDAAMGNMVFPASAETLSSADESKNGLPILVKQVRQSIEAIDSEYIKYAQQDVLKMLGQMHMGGDSEKLECTNFVRSGYEDIDFGWGKPIWVSVFGESGSKFMDWVLLKRINASEKGVEAWVRLRQDVMDVLEKDPEFLSYASINPPIVSSIP